MGTKSNSLYISKIPLETVERNDKHIVTVGVKAHFADKQHENTHNKI